MALKGQVALVLGGAGGIGSATVRELLQEGANVVIGDASSAAGETVTEQLRGEFGAQRCVFVKVDVRDDAEFENALVVAKEHFKKLDIIVNCAGVVNDFDWNLEVDINLKGIIRGTLLAWKHMGKQEGGKGGVIVNIASILGLEHIGSIPVYSATKHAVVGFGRSCGTPFNLQRTGVRVITMCPGGTDTTMIVPSKQPKYMTPEHATQFEKELLNYSIQKPESVAKAILHVLQHGASGSVWVSESDEPAYEVEIPERQDMRVTR